MKLKTIFKVVAIYECLRPLVHAILLALRKLVFNSKLLKDVPWVVNALIGANVLIFLAWTLASRSRESARFMFDHFSVSAVGVLEQGRVHTLLTSMFSHRSLGHLITNCVTLNLLRVAATHMGTRKFIEIYVSGGVASFLGWVAWSRVAPGLKIPASTSLSKSTRALGASGAINAVLGWWWLRTPFRTIVLGKRVRLPAWIVPLACLCSDLYVAYVGSREQASACHVAGALVGGLFALAS